MAESIEGMRLCYGTASGRLASDVVDSGNHSPEFLSRAKTECLLSWSLHEGGKGQVVSNHMGGC